MSNVIHLTDNCSAHLIKEESTLQDVLQIADMGSLQNNPELLVFPHSFKEHNDGIEKLSVLSVSDTRYEDGKHFEKHVVQEKILTILINFPILFLMGESGMNAQRSVVDPHKTH